MIIPAVMDPGIIPKTVKLKINKFFNFFFFLEFEN